MQTIQLYRYTRPDGGVTVSPIKPEGEYTEAFRLVADEGMILVNGDRQTSCVDVDTADGWTEIPHVEGNEIENAKIAEMQREIDDMRAALAVMGVEK